MLECPIWSRYERAGFAVCDEFGKGELAGVDEAGADAWDPGKRSQDRSLSDRPTSSRCFQPPQFAVELRFPRYRLRVKRSILNGTS